MNEKESIGPSSVTEEEKQEFTYIGEMAKHFVNETKIIEGTKSFDKEKAYLEILSVIA